MSDDMQVRRYTAARIAARAQHIGATAARYLGRYAALVDYAPGDALAAVKFGDLVLILPVAHLELLYDSPEPANGARP